MARSKETYSKKEKEKKRLKQRQEKQEKMAERKQNREKGKSLEEMIAYVDDEGNLTTSPPDPGEKRVINAEDIQISPPKAVAVDDVPRTGTVSFFNEAKGYGFIIDQQSNERIFVHINDLDDMITANDRVSFQVRKSPRGLNAYEVKKQR